MGPISMDEDGLVTVEEDFSFFLVLRIVNEELKEGQVLTVLR
jgi:hypothetical protein